jgi:peptidoglycan/LPS O-acetylase OafA/YrhL
MASNSSLPLKSSYIPGIDGLRAIAVLSVILFHFKAFILPGGFSGVDVFFVISGYVVTGSLARETPANFWRFVAHFYARRIVRIYPALLVCLITTVVLQTLLVPLSWLSTTSSTTAKYAFFGVSNYALILFDDGYFAPRVEFNAFTHTWSLAVEEQFYLLFPAVFFIWMKRRDQAGLSGALSKWALTILLLASLVYSGYETTANPDHAYYLLPSRFWELACGALLYKLHAQDKYVARSNQAASLSLLGGLLLIGLGLAFADAARFPFPWALPSVLGAMLVIVGVSSRRDGPWALSRVLDNPFMVYVGKASYSLYLWHWPVIVLFRWTVGLEEPMAIGAAVALTIMASLLSFHFVEKPVRESRFVLNRPNMYIVTRGLAIILLSLGFSSLVLRVQHRVTLSVTGNHRLWYPEPWPALADKVVSHPMPLAGRRIFALGDSHAEAYSTMFQMLTDQQGVHVKQYAHAGCAVANLIKPADAACMRSTDEFVASIIKEAVPGDLVFLSSLRMSRLGNQWGTYDKDAVVARQGGAEAARERALALNEADALITRLEKASMTVLIDAPKPVFRSPPFRCADWFNASNPACQGGFELERAFLQGHRQPAMASLAALKQKHPSLIVWDPFPVLCSSPVCKAFDATGPLFFDGDHLSAHGNRLLYPSFYSTIATIWPDKAAAHPGGHQLP